MIKTVEIESEKMDGKPHLLLYFGKGEILNKKGRYLNFSPIA